MWASTVVLLCACASALGAAREPAASPMGAGNGVHAERMAAADRSLMDGRGGADPSSDRILQDRGAPGYQVEIPSVLWWSLGALAVLSLLAAAIAVVLRRLVHARTRHLQAREKRLATILDSVGAFIYMKGNDYRYQYANDHTVQLFGCAGQDVVGLEDSAFFDAATTARLRANDRRVLEAGETLEEEETNTRQGGGDTRVYLSIKQPMRNPDGSIHGLCGISINVTERRRSEEMLQTVSTVFESSGGMTVTGPDHRILTANQAFTRMSGYRVEELVGRKATELYSERHDAQFHAALKSALRNQGMWQGEVWHRRKDAQEYPAWVTIMAVRSPGGDITHYVGTQADLSERKAAEEEVRKFSASDPPAGPPTRRLVTGA
jgi:PAS domain S-box-containing protein